MVMPSASARLEPAIAALNAAGEETRLRLLALLAQCELTVSEVVSILGQSQPRVSRHLKLLVDAGLVERRREGAWAFFRLAQTTGLGSLARDIVAWLDLTDRILAEDSARLTQVRHARAENAARYFAAHAEEWDNIRSLHAPETLVEAAMRDAIGQKKLGCFVDLGTGAGRMLEIFSPLAERAIGVDLSSAMLAVARGRLEETGLDNVQLRQGDLYALPIQRNSVDLAIMHQVLHYLDDPARALKEAARILAPGGRLLVVDFAPHQEEVLRDKHAHRRLGFSENEITRALTLAGLDTMLHRELAPDGREGAKLTVSLWLARDPRLISDVAPVNAYEAV
jgi:demethylmenaquinone methyltransferase/2-methoxy-6-polyprenyl-1,4-benzoquinol methylase/ArsR family transcriptional regulator